MSAELEAANAKIAQLERLVSSHEETTKDLTDEVANLKESAAGDASELVAAQMRADEAEERIAQCAEAYGHVLAGDMGGAREVFEQALDAEQQFTGQQSVPRIKAVLEARARQ